MIVNGLQIREQLLALLSRKDYRPLSKVEIARKLGVSGRARVAFRRTLRELERAGEIARIRKDRYVLPGEADLVTGKLSVHPAATPFSAPKNRMSRMFLLRRKMSAQRCMGIVSLRGYCLKRLPGG
jgi:exoribonuclease R